ncbi:MAG: septal ring lytic transglycosylase RlpA family protein [Burkholderiales bacterium]|nr:septal ring lytic transglycosylase RlpA family protein [Burkholderiales bacterium]
MRASSCLILVAVLSMLAACAGPRGAGDTPRRSGGYYLDDGPPAAAPVDLAAIADAQPRAEPIKASTARPYTALGQRYVPMTEHRAYSATGIASWYGKRYHGRPTASGEPYDMFAMTAAHPLLPIPSYARVTRVDTQRSVVVRINDRGPFLAERLIDLSYVAAYKLDMLGAGQARVRVDSILPHDVATTRTSASTPAAASAPQADAVFLQLGAFAAPANAQTLAERARARLPEFAGLTSVLEQDGMFRVRTGPFADRTAAMQAAQQIAALLDLQPVVLSR